MNHHKQTVEIINLLNIPIQRTSELIGKSCDTVSRKKSDKYPEYSFNESDFKAISAFAHGIINRLNTILP